MDGGGIRAEMMDFDDSVGLSREDLKGKRR